MNIDSDPGVLRACRNFSGMASNKARCMIMISSASSGDVTAARGGKAESQRSATTSFDQRALSCGTFLRDIIDHEMKMITHNGVGIYRYRKTSSQVEEPFSEPDLAMLKVSF